ncbi:exopolysaccharide biosynthesis protein [Thalassospira mesophila]|uniref:exopolysaccharide biosynthesis protein n=1 Tax=Thalassospira mesophila TaxID=1293891 RepID=UPI000A1FC5A9|nr:exopolysaccharide biosynthesis protein [Thalassospira mesophila]
MNFEQPHSQSKPDCKNDNPVTGIIDQLVETGRVNGDVTLGEMTHALRFRSYGPFLLVPGLIGVSPLGAIPGVPTLLGILIALFAVQMVLGRTHIWLPDIIERQSVAGARLEAAMEKMHPVGRWLDRHFHERLEGVLTHRTIRVAAGICLLLVLPMPFFELVPFAAALPMVAVAGFGLAMTLRDGVVMIAAGIAALVAIIGCVALMI